MNVLRVPFLPIALLALASAPTHGSKITIHRAASSGDPVEGAAHALGDLQGETINGDGDIVFHAGYPYEEHIVAWSADQLELRLSEGEETSVLDSESRATRYGEPRNPFLSKDGDAFVLVPLTRTTTTATVVNATLWKAGPGGALGLLARSDDGIVPDGQWDASSIALVSSGSPAFALAHATGSFPTDDGATTGQYIRFSADGAAAVALVDGSAAPGVDGNFSSIAGVEMNPDGEIVFSASASTEQNQTRGIWRFGGGATLSVIAYQGMAVPGIDGVTFSDVENGQVDDSSRTYFLGETSDGKTGVWSGLEANDLSPIALTDSEFEMPRGLGVGSLATIDAFEVAANGIVYFRAQATIPSLYGGYTNTLWRWSEDGLELVVHDQESAPNGETWSSFGSVAAGPEGRVAFYGSSGPPNEVPTTQGIWATGPDGGLALIAAENTHLETTSGTLDHSVDAFQLNSGGGADGRRRAWADDGSLLFGAQVVGQPSMRELFIAKFKEPSNLFVWNGAAGDNNWHTKLPDGTTNWEDEDGARVDPPGQLGNEIVHITADTVVIDKEPVLIFQIDAKCHLQAERRLDIAGESTISSLTIQEPLAVGARLTIGGGSKSRLVAHANIDGSGELEVVNATLTLAKPLKISVPVIARDVRMQVQDNATLAGGGRLENVTATADIPVQLILGTDESASLFTIGGENWIDGTSKVSTIAVDPRLWIHPGATLALENDAKLIIRTGASIAGTVMGSGELRSESMLELNGGTIASGAATPLQMTTMGGVLITNPSTLSAEWTVELGSVTQAADLTLNGGTILIQSGTKWELQRSFFQSSSNILEGSVGGTVQNQGEFIIARSTETFGESFLIDPQFSNTGTLRLGAPDDARITLFIRGPVDEIEGTTLSDGHWYVGEGAELQIPGRSITSIAEPAKVTLKGAFPQLQLERNSSRLAIGPGVTVETPSDFGNDPRGSIEIEGLLDVSGNLENEGSISSIMNEIESVIVPLGRSVSDIGAASDEPAVFANGIHADTLINSGILEPGGEAQAGVLPLDGSLTLQEASTVSIELGGVEPGTGHDWIRATGDITLGGKLEVRGIELFAPEVGQRFDILVSDSAISEAFSQLSLPCLSGITFEVEYGAQAVALLAIACPATYEDWALAVFSDSEREDPTLSGPSADFDHDGSSNLLEYATGSDARRANAAPLSIRVESSGHVVVTFPWRGEVEDAQYELQSRAATADAWSNVEPDSIETLPSNGPSQRVFRSFEGMAPGTALFRLRVEEH